MDQEFPGKIIADTLIYYYYYYYFDRPVERWGARHNNEQSCQRQMKNPRQKWKHRKMSWGVRQRIVILLQSDAYISKRLLMLLYQDSYLHKEKETSLLTSLMVNFGLTATSLFKIWTPAWIKAPLLPAAFTKESFFFTWQSGILSFFSGPIFFSFFFFPQGLSSAFDFSMRKNLRANLRANVSMHQTNSGKSPKFVFPPNFIFYSPICSNNCGVVFCENIF